YSNGAIHFKTKHFSKYVAIPAEVNLKDIYEATWATDSIEALAARGIVKGVSADSFLPMKEVTRAEFVQMIVETFDLKSEAVINPFSDVVKGEWYEKAVLTAYELGIIKGKPDGTFGVNEKITRQDMAVITYSALKAAGININATSKPVIFEDDTLISEYAKEAVAAMQRAGIINGMPGNIFAPKDTANRAQAAVILAKLLDEL
ncbi:MAG TPA: S-layer homology domain-containing protein, partial [Acetivibrio clariflavus]|nr:S-layer homology domain-containing protein [Acetivibrio clariflavus]